MTWLKTDDRYPEHRKIRRLSDGAYRLHHTALSACAKDETDGLITADDLADMAHGMRLRKNITALVTAGLWEEVDGGWQVHDYLDYNPSHAELEAKRARDRERQNRYRKGAVHDSPPRDVTRLSQRDSAVTRASVTAPRPVPSRTRPVPVPSSTTESEGSS